MDLINKEQSLARGYISSGEFRQERVPQHIQNQIIKLYCDLHCLIFVLSRAEYWIDGSTDCQLWAALREGFKHVVFYSFWQLPEKKVVRKEIYSYCIKNNIILHFATERMRTDSSHETFSELEILMKTNLLITEDIDHKQHLTELKIMMSQIK